MKTILVLGLLVFVALAVVALPLAAAPVADEGSVDLEVSNYGTCAIGGRMANYGQTAGGVTIKPYRQWNIDGVWLREYWVKGPAGKVLAIETTTYICAGMRRDPRTGFDQCPPDKATSRVVQMTNFTIPAGGVGTFVVEGAAGCCSIMETSITRVNGNRWWGSSFFLRWAESPECVYNGEVACRVGGRMANYGQTAGGVTIQPLAQRQIGQMWWRHWSVKGPAGTELEIVVVTYTCQGAMKDPVSGYDLCTAEKATSTVYQTVHVVIPPSGSTVFDIGGVVGCCNLMQSDIFSVNGRLWLGADFFIRWAESAACVRR